MRDLLPEEASARRHLGRRALACLSLHGYAVVTPPVFEFADVLERGLGTLDPTDVLRFIEPESGEVAALRPDMTPQIARIVATRLRGRPAPFRLSYEGTVLRRRSGRARKHRQIPQVGAELAGVAGPDGDLELLDLAAQAVRAMGLEQFTIDVGDAGIVRSLLATVAPEHHAAISDALARKDPADLRTACAAAKAEYGDAIVSLPSLHGERRAVEEGASRLARTPAAAAAHRLLALFRAAEARGLGPHLTADLGEVRGFEYYTGTVFHVYAPGTGDAVGSGGRYDELLARFGWDLPAAGFALDLDRVGEAMSAAGVTMGRDVRVVVVGGADDASLADLRGRGVASVSVPDRAGALAWARGWGFSHVLDATHGTAEWVDVESGASIASPMSGSAVERAEK